MSPTFLPVSSWFLPILGQESLFQVVFSHLFRVAILLFTLSSRLVLGVGANKILLLHHYLVTPLFSFFCFSFPIRYLIFIFLSIIFSFCFLLYFCILFSVCFSSVFVSCLLLLFILSFLPFKFFSFVDVVLVSFFFSDSCVVVVGGGGLFILVNDFQFCLVLFSQHLYNLHNMVGAEPHSIPA